MSKAEELALTTLVKLLEVQCNAAETLLAHYQMVAKSNAEILARLERIERHLDSAQASLLEIEDHTK